MNFGSAFLGSGAGNISALTAGQAAGALPTGSTGGGFLGNLLGSGRTDLQGNTIPGASGEAGGLGGSLAALFKDPQFAGILGQLGQAFAPQNQFVQKLGQATIDLAKSQTAKKLLDEETKKAQEAQEKLVAIGTAQNSPYAAGGNATGMTTPTAPQAGTGTTAGYGTFGNMFK